MSSIKLSESQANSLYFDDSCDGYTKVDESDLCADIKCEIGTFVIKDEKTGKYYEGSIQRTGTYWTDYDYYFDDEFYEVEQVEVTIKQWKKVEVLNS